MRILLNIIVGGERQRAARFHKMRLQHIPPVGDDGLTTVVQRRHPQSTRGGENAMMLMFILSFAANVNAILNDCVAIGSDRVHFRSLSLGSSPKQVHSKTTGVVVLVQCTKSGTMYHMIIVAKTKPSRCRVKGERVLPVVHRADMQHDDVANMM